MNGMKNILLSVAVVATLIAAGVGGTFAGFIDTEVSQNNFVQAGIADLLVNGVNNPGAKIEFVHAAPCKSVDFWIDLFSRSECQGGTVYMHFKDVESVEAGVKDNAVWNGTDYVPAGPDGPKGAGLASSEPELMAEEGNGYIGDLLILPGDPGVMGVDYATGVAAHTGVTVTIPLEGGAGNFMGNPDTNNDGFVDPTEYAAWTAAGNRWQVITSLTGKLLDIACHKDVLGFLHSQEKTFIHVDLHVQQLEDPSYPRDYDLDGNIDDDDAQLRFWPTNALQGDMATWSMLFELVTDP